MHFAKPIANKPSSIAELFNNPIAITKQVNSSSIDTNNVNEIGDIGDISNVNETDNLGNAGLASNVEENGGRNAVDITLGGDERPGRETKRM